MYKVGDKVRIRADLVPEDFYGNNNVGWSSLIYNSLGLEGVIISDQYKGCMEYRVETEINSFWYIEKHLEAVTILEFKFIYDV